MFNFFKPNSKKKINKEYLQLLKDAMECQRNGDIKTYSLLTLKAQKLKAQMDSA